MEVYREERIIFNFRNTRVSFILKQEKALPYIGIQIDEHYNL